MAETSILIYFDLVGYSKNNEIIQVGFFKGFQKELHHLLYDEIMATEQEAILIPTGDGMIIGLKENEKNEKYLRAIEVVFKVFKWSEKNSVGLRCAVHVGSVNRLKDINRQDNIIGNTINDASRMLGGADNGSIVVSKEFFYKYLRSSEWTFGVEYKLPNDYIFTLLDEDVVIDKHSEVHTVFSIEFKDNDGFKCGCEGRILSKYDFTVYSKEYPKLNNMKDKFFSIVRNGEDINLVGIYHPNTPKILGNIYANENKIVSLNIYYAADSLREEIKTFFGSKPGNLDFVNKKKSISEVKKWYENYSNSEYVNLKIYEYQSLLSLGASAVDIKIQGKGFIHVSNYLRGVVPEDTPYIEMKWKTRKMAPLYAFYFNYLRKNILEKGEMIFSSSRIP